MTCSNGLKLENGSWPAGIGWLMRVPGKMKGCIE